MTPMLFFILFLSFCLRVIRKGLRKNSEIFVNLRRSSGQSMRERSDRWPEFWVFKSVPGCIEGIPGHYGMFGGIMGCSRGVPGLFQAVPGVFRGVPGVFRGVPGVFRGVPGRSGVFRVCSGFYRHPKKLACSNLKKTGKEEERSAAYYSYRIFVTIDVELVVILVIDLLIFTKLCISSVSCTCLVQDHFRPSEVSIFGSGRDNK